MFNRALQGVYPPGSTFKLVVSSAALEEKKITPNTMFEDTGVIKAGSLTFGNWYYFEYGKKEGMVDVVKAIQRSNDIFFYKIGGLIGSRTIKDYAFKFGFGKKTGIGLPESNGTIPSPFWKKEVVHSDWFLGDTYNFSIGQGYVLTTPIQIAQATAVFANNGFLCKPKLLRSDKSAYLDAFLQRYATTECKNLHISNQTLNLVRKEWKKHVIKEEQVGHSSILKLSLTLTIQ